MTLRAREQEQGNKSKSQRTEMFTKKHQVLQQMSLLWMRHCGCCDWLNWFDKEEQMAIRIIGRVFASVFDTICSLNLPSWNVPMVVYLCNVHIIFLPSKLAFIRSSPGFELIKILANELFSAASRPNLKLHASPVRFSCVHLIHRE